MRNIVVEITQKAHKPNEVIARILKKLKKDVELKEAKQFFLQLSQDETGLAELITGEKLIPTDEPEDFLDTMITLSAALAFIAANSPEPKTSLTKQIMGKEPLISHSEKLKYERALTTIINYKETLNNLKKHKLNPVEAEAAKMVFYKDTGEILENLLGKASKMSFKDAMSLNKVVPSPIIEAGTPTYILNLQSDFEAPAPEEEAETPKVVRQSEMNLSSRAQTDVQRIAGRKENSV